MGVFLPGNILRRVLRGDDQGDDGRMSNFTFGVDGYRLNYYPEDALDDMDGVDWEKVTSVEIDWHTFVKQRTCKNSSDDSCWFECSSCKCTCSIDYLGGGLGLPNFCPNCGVKVVVE